MRDSVARWARPLGSLLAVACLAWIGWRFHQAGVWQHAAASPRSGALLTTAVAVVPFYCFALSFLGVAWWCLLRTFSGTSATLRPVFSVYAITQFGKYLPGNVAQYVGRHLMSRRLEVDHASLLVATGAEAAFLLSAAVVLAGSGLGLLVHGWPARLGGWQNLLIVCVLIVSAILVVDALRTRSPRVARFVPLRSKRFLLPVLPLHLCFFLLMALCVVAVATILLPQGDVLWLLPAAVATSWIAGFIAVGAPAGIGVREFVFLAMLKGHASEPDILLLAACFRGITFGGDALFLGLGWLLRTRTSVAHT